MAPLVLAVLLAINGNVIKRDGAPVANAHVTATRPGGAVLARTVTDADGAFKFEPVDGVVDLEAEADGFLPARVTMLADEQPITLVMEAGSASAAPAQKPAPRDELPADIHGTMRDEANRPIEGAEMLGNSGARAITDAKGEFAVAVPGDYDIFRCNAGINARCPFVRLKAGDRADIVAERLAAIDGVLRDHDGAPIPGASVSLRRDNTSGYESDGTVTDAAGRFRFFTDPEGAAQLIARKPGRPAAVSNRLELSKKGVHGFTLIMPRGIEVHGVVTDANGHGLGGVTIDTASQPRQMPASHWATTANDGSFNVRMNEGTSELRFAKTRYLAMVVPIEVTSSMRPIAVKLQPIAYIRGTLVRKDGSPVAKRSITAKEMLVAEVQSNADGTFELPFPKAGSYAITTGLVGHETTLRAPANDIRVVFDEGLSLRGRVIDEASGAPITSFEIAASSGPDEHSATLKSHDESGNFTLAGLLPGPATVQVYAARYLLASVAAQAGQQEPLTIALKRGLTLRGRVRDESGQPVEHAAIVADEDQTSSDADGTFEFASLESRELTIRVSGLGYIGREMTVAPRQFGEPLEIVLSSGLHVKGRVVTADGQPVAIGIAARSADVGAPASFGSSDASGRFEITGLSPARYDFLAGGEDTALYGVVREIEVEHVREIVIPVARHESGTITGRVTGLSPEYVTRIASAVAHEGELRSPINDDGTFRIEGVAAGKGSVFVMVTNASGKQRTALERVDVPSGGEAHVEIAFGPLRLLHGRVTRAGRPLSRVSVSFSGDSSTETAITDADGRYEVSLESAPYEVSVREGTPDVFEVMDLPYRGEVDAQQTVFDVAIEGVELRVHVIDAQTGEPVAGAGVFNADMEALILIRKTGDDGTTTAEIASGKTIALRVEKDGYGPALVESAGGDVVVKLAKAVKVAVRVVDARDGRTLAAGVAALDAKDRVVWPRTEPGSDGLVTFDLAPGDYHFSTGFDGFEPETVRAAVPSSGEVRIALRRKTD